MAEDGKILIVDDDDGQRALMEEMARSFGYDTESAADGFEALSEMKLGCDLVLLDANMPGMDGFEVARRLREDGECSDVPIIMVTGLDNAEDRRRALEVGADDFISKPVDHSELNVRIEALLDGRDREQAHGDGGRVAQEVKRRTAELEKSVRELTHARRDAYSAQIETIERLAVASEFRDEDTGAHVRRVGEYCALMAEHLHLSPGRVEQIRYAAPLHDVGKIGIPDSILLKPAKLAPEEWKTMKQHTTMGGHILADSSSRFLKAGREIALTHHEKWDGTGYPEGTSGEEIPLFGRICAVADVFDALTGERPYREALPPEEAVDILKDGKAQHFDPEVLDAFFDEYDRALEIRRENPNTAPATGTWSGTEADASDGCGV